MPDDIVAFERALKIFYWITIISRLGIALQKMEKFLHDTILLVL